MVATGCSKVGTGVSVFSINQSINQSRVVAKHKMSNGGFEASSFADLSGLLSKFERNPYVIVSFSEKSFRETSTTSSASTGGTPGSDTSKKSLTKASTTWTPVTPTAAANAPTLWATLRIWFATSLPHSNRLLAPVLPRYRAPPAPCRCSCAIQATSTTNHSWSRTGAAWSPWRTRAESCIRGPMGNCRRTIRTLNWCARQCGGCWATGTREDRNYRDCVCNWTMALSWWIFFPSFSSCISTE